MLSRAAVESRERVEEEWAIMIKSQRVLQDIRFDEMGSELAIVLTIEVGDEIVVERIILGAVDPKEIGSAVTAALKDLQKRRGLLVSAA